MVLMLIKLSWSSIVGKTGDFQSAVWHSCLSRSTRPHHSTTRSIVSLIGSTLEFPSADETV
jgi:hypothetical protein